MSQTEPSPGSDCASAPPEGPVIALELNGDGVVDACKNIANEVFSGTKVRGRASLRLNVRSSQSAHVCLSPPHRFLSLTTRTRPLETWTTSSTSLTCRWACDRCRRSSRYLLKPLAVQLYIQADVLSAMLGQRFG